MPPTNPDKHDRLRISRVVDVPLREVSGICLRRGRDRQMSLLAVGDRAAKVVWISLPESDDESLDWQTKNIGTFTDSDLAGDDPQIEAVCADGAGRVLLLQEWPPRVELVDFEMSQTLASIELHVEGNDEIAVSWADPAGSHGEGMVLLPGGHLLVAKEKDPAALIEFGPPGSRSQGLTRGGALAAGDRWVVAEGKQEFVGLATWLPGRALAKACKDLSDLEIGPDGCLYLLSDQSESIARIDDLSPGGGTAALGAVWRLENIEGKPEGLAFTAEGRAVVALDKPKTRKNLVLLNPPIATANAAQP